MYWSIDRVLALAPDSGSASAGRGLASLHKWTGLGATDRTVWGLCQGSGAKPYQVAIDLAEPAFKCTCPSRKFPCKHGIGLFLLLIDKRNLFGDSACPQWVTEWLDKRDERAQAKTEKNEEKQQKSDPAALESDRAKRAAQREAKVAGGLKELDVWLRDLIRSGLAAAQTRPSSFWEHMAARLVDAQAPGLARRIRELETIPSSGTGWPERLLERVGRLHLLVEGYRRIESLPEDMQAAVRSHVGWTVKQEELVQSEGIRSEWLVVGRRVEQEDKLLVQRTWLLSAQGPALILNFAAPGQSLDTSLVPGHCLDAELVYFPGSYKMRAAIKQVFTEPPTIRNVACLQDVVSFRQSFAKALAADPWIERFPFAVTNVSIIRNPDGWSVADKSGESLPVTPQFRKSWHLQALSGGNPITLFAEWDGGTLYPLSAVAESRFTPFLPGRDEG